MPTHLSNKIIKVFSNPVLARNFIKAKLIRTFGSKEYIAERQNRSESDGGDYVYFVRKAISNYKLFINFKRHPSYQAILEHVNKEDGEKYLEIIKNQSPSLLRNIDNYKANDLIGNPIKHIYPEIGEISPTTLRYLKVTSDLSRLFNNCLGEKVVEIGVGYGGQLLINDRTFDIKEYHLFDLPPVLILVSQYLESFILNCAYKINTLNQSNGEQEFDLVISNYAFSELPEQLQRVYIKKVLSKSKKGYLTMNSGVEGSTYKHNHLSLSELRELLPSFEIIEENPLSSPNNYIIIWGHTKSN